MPAGSRRAKCAQSLILASRVDVYLRSNAPPRAGCDSRLQRATPDPQNRAQIAILFPLCKGCCLGRPIQATSVFDEKKRGETSEPIRLLAFVLRLKLRHEHLHVEPAGGGLVEKASGLLAVALGVEGVKGAEHQIGGRVAVVEP